MNAVTIKYSRGYGKNGKLSAYVRPKQKCFNRDRKVSAFSNEELNEAINKCVQKYYEPMVYYKIGEYIIGSNNKTNAHKEWWRVCDRKDIGKIVEITEVI